MKIKHKLIRCKNSIINNDEDVCSLHEITPNIYWDQYNELIEINILKRLKITSLTIFIKV